ncbi:hypothetical protein V494_03608 [Pseudogymnoascus sp. VKM F-4513 (FW-928)]|nr:hypothetical protein V494_03608 [Pseudogymnoascus sp. VKM F-4513 (FW-928)]
MQFTFLAIALATLLGSAAAAPNSDVANGNLEVLPRFTHDGLPIIDMRGNQNLDKRANCQNSPGVANGACVKYFRTDGKCGGSGASVSYKPTCAGNCYVDNFQSISVAGDGTYGTNCEIYSDNHCGDKTGETGNHVIGAAKCLASKGSSMRCYYRC